MSTPARVPLARLLLVEDNPADADLVREHLFDIGEEVPGLDVVASLEAGLEKVRSGDYAAVLLDLNLPDSTGLRTLDRMLAEASSEPVIVLTGAQGEDLGLEAVARGAADFLPKDELTGRLLLRSVRYGVERAHRRGAEARYRALVESSRDLVSILDRDLSIRYVSPSLRSVLGYSPEEKLEADSLLEVHPEDQAGVEAAVGRLLSDPSYTAHLDYRVRHADGSWRLLDTIAQNCFDQPHIRGLLVSSRDVTDLRSAQEEAARTAHRLERTLGALDDAVLTVETTGWTIVDCNPAAESIFGYGPDELVGRSTRVLHADGPSSERLGTESVPVLRRGEPYQDELRMRRKDGTPFPAEATLTLLEPEGGLHEGIVMVVRDITGRVENERQMRFQAALLEEVGQPVLAVDEAGKVTYWNQTIQELTGLSRSQVFGREVLDRIVDMEDREAALAAREMARSGGRWEGELRIRRADGGTAIMQVTAAPAMNPDGSPGGRIAAGVDVTDLRRAEEESRRAAERLRLQADMLEAVGQAVIATDLDSRVIFWNQAAEELYGWSREEALGKSVLDLTPSEATREQGEEIFEALRAGEAWTGEFEVRRRDGSTFMARITDAPILDADGGLIGVIGVSSDISSEKRMETQLRQAQKMEAIGRLAGGVAHDFNNFLTAVEGHTNLLLQDLGDTRLREDVEEIRQAGRRAADLTRQLLAFSREQMLQVRRVDVCRAVRELESMLRRLVPERIDLGVQVPGEDVVVEVDPGQLQQVVMNLVVNAADAIEAVGTVRIRVEGRELSAEETEALPWVAEPGSYAALVVEDTGSGMPEEVLEHIFEPFFTTKAEGHGTGLGLATVYGIVKQSSGHVFVDSVPGRGTTFEVLLPRTSGKADEVKENAEPAPAVESAVILLVEDDEAVRRVGRRILDRAGYTVVEAADGAEALQRVESSEHAFDLVISDVVMPGLGGVELQKRLKARHPDLRVVLTSGYSEKEMRTGIRELGAAFLPKPFTPEQLLGAVAEALSGHPDTA